MVYLFIGSDEDGEESLKNRKHKHDDDDTKPIFKRRVFEKVGCSVNFLILVRRTLTMDDDDIGDYYETDKKYFQLLSCKENSFFH